MNPHKRLSPPARVELWHNDAALPELHTGRVTLRPAFTRSDVITKSGVASGDQIARPAPRTDANGALKDAVWMVPDGDGWAEVYGDGDGWAIWDVEVWAPAISYGDAWAVPNGDGWTPYDAYDTEQEH